MVGEAGGGDEPDNTVQTGLRENIIELDADCFIDDGTDLMPLRNMIGERQIIGLGEATHGSAEFFRLKHRILRFLVKELGVRLCGLEANFAEVVAVNKYIRGGEGEPLPFRRQWIWKTEEMLSIIEWLKEFNTGRLPEDEVRLFGFDMQDARGAAAFIADYLDRVDPEYLNEVRDDLDSLAAHGLRLDEAGGGGIDLTHARRVLPALQSKIDERRPQYISRSSDSAWDLARQHVTVLSQATEFGEAVQQSDGLFDEDALRIRDRAMAQNVEWILDSETEDRLAIWAHNDHINRVKSTARGFEVESMGSHLTRHKGESYYAIGFEFGRGSFLANRSNDSDSGGYERRECSIGHPHPSSLASALSNLGLTPALLDVRRAEADQRVGEWLDRDHVLHSIGTVYDPSNPGNNLEVYHLTEAFDGLCYVDETSGTNLLDDS